MANLAAAEMTEHTREVLSRMEANSDCTVRSSDGQTFLLSKSSLAEHSQVLGGIIRELDSRSETEFTVEEDGKSFALLLDVMYSRIPFSGETPIMPRNVSTVLELTQKYDVESATVCDHVLCQVELDEHNTRETYVLASEYGLRLTLEKCREYIKEKNDFADYEVEVYWPVWLDELAHEEQILLLKELLRRRIEDDVIDIDY